MTSRARGIRGTRGTIGSRWTRKELLAVVNIGDPNLAPCSIPTPVSHARVIEMPYSIHVRIGQIATCAHPDERDRIDSCIRPSTPMSNPGRQAKASSQSVPGAGLRGDWSETIRVQE